jgi:hypothetical protein
MHQLRTQYLCQGQQPRCPSRLKTKIKIKIKTGIKTGFKTEFKAKPFASLL